MHSLIDIGANLTHDSFDADREAVIQQAIAAGVEQMIVTGATSVGSSQAAELARQYSGVLYATAGVHPHYAAEYVDDTGELLTELLVRSEVLAVGECGLDYFRNFSPVEAQKRAFQAQLELAIDCGKPVFLHQREAHDDFVAILNDCIADINGGVAHCFTGGLNEMREYLDMGLYIGITGWVCDERRGHDLQDAVPHLPLDRLLLETDAPYLVPRDLPEKMPARRNEPRALPHILSTVARLMNRDEAEVAAAATRNTKELFGM